MKLIKLLPLATIFVLSGCAYQQPSTILNSIAQDEGSIKAKIVNAAYRNNWKVCTLQQNTLQLYKDFNKFQISLIAKYSELDRSYDLSIDPTLTSLVDKSGRVHPRANKILYQTNNLIKRSSGQVVNDEIPNCSAATKVKTFKGSMFSGTKTRSQLFWKNHEEKIPNDKKFDVFVMDNDQIPDAFLQSMEERTAESLMGLNKLSTSSTSYVIEITLKNFNQKTMGAAVDFMTGQGNQKMEATAIIFDPTDKELCRIEVQTYIPIGGWGIISRSSNKITKTINDAIITHLIDDVIDR